MWDTIFKAGYQTNSNGQTREYTVDDLHRLAATKGKIPVVVKHPTDVSGTVIFGNVARLRVSGAELQAQYENIPDTLRAAVDQGLKLGKSVSIDPGTMTLQHVGLLGNGQEPAVTGLGPVYFAKSDTDHEPSIGYRLFNYV